MRTGIGQQASPRSHGVPRRDVPGRVNVSVAGVVAGYAGEVGLALAALRCDVPARRAPLARVRGVDLLDPTGGLVLQAPGQQAPAGRGDLPVQPGLGPDVPTRCLGGPLGRARHAGDAQILNPDHVEPAREVRGDLLAPVLPRVRLTGSQAADGCLDADAPAAAAPGAGQPALKQDQPPLSLRAQPGHRQQFTRRQRSADGHTPVDAHGLPVAGPGDGLWDGSKRDVPATGTVQRDTVGLAVRNGAGPAEPHPAGLGHPDDARVAGQPPHMRGLHRDDTKALIPASLAPRRPAVCPAEEVRHGPREIPQCLLLNHLAAHTQPGMLPARGGQLPALLQVAGSVLPAGPPKLMLLDREIPHEPGMPAMLPQHRLLGRRRKQTVPGHTNTLATAADITGG